MEAQTIGAARVSTGYIKLTDLLIRSHCSHPQMNNIPQTMSFSEDELALLTPLDPSLFDKIEIEEAMSLIWHFYKYVAEHNAAEVPSQCAENFHAVCPVQCLYDRDSH